MSHFDLLKSCPIFSNLSDSEMILLEKNCDEKTLSIGESLSETGVISKGFFLVKSGKFSVEFNDKISYLIMGHYIGGFSLYKDNLKAKLNVSAIEASTVLGLSHKNFMVLIKENPEIKFKIAYAILLDHISDLDILVDTL